jgi:hypothetical protein
VIEGTTRHQTALGKLVLRDDRVDGQVRGNVVDVVGLHPTGRAVVKEQVIALVLQKAKDLRVTQGGEESGIPVEVEVRIPDTDTSSRDLLVPDLGDRPDEISEEGLRQEHPDEVGLKVEGIPCLL